MSTTSRRAHVRTVYEDSLRATLNDLLNEHPRFEHLLIATLTKKGTFTARRSTPIGLLLSWPVVDWRTQFLSPLVSRRRSLSSACLLDEEAYGLTEVRADTEVLAALWQRSDGRKPVLTRW